ncbi:hypothetical protein Ancab_005656 [Ancistrocladus abbreviatus]
MAYVSLYNNAHVACSRAHNMQSNRDFHPLVSKSLIFKAKGCRRKKGCSVVGIVASHPDVDFTDPDWKTKFQKDFEGRFHLPHLRHVVDIKPLPTTFSLMSSVVQVLNRTNLLKDEDNELGGANVPQDRKNDYVNDDDRALLKVIRYCSPTSAGADCIDPECTWVEQWVHRAGPRKQIYFEPKKVKAAIVTCGGLCPGLNDVIRQFPIRSVLLLSSDLQKSCRLAYKSSFPLSIMQHIIWFLQL